MSLRPSRHSDKNKAWMQPRKDRVKKIQPEYHLIVTEGTKTEPAYFESIQNAINQQYRGRIQLDIYGEGNNTLSLFHKAKKGRRLTNRAKDSKRANKFFRDRFIDKPPVFLILVYTKQQSLLPR